MSYQNGAESSLADNVFGELNTFLLTALSQKETSQKLEQDCSRLKQVVAEQNDKVQVSSPRVFLLRARYRSLATLPWRGIPA